MGRRGTAKSLSKKPEELVEDVEAMAEKAGIELPKARAPPMSPSTPDSHVPIDSPCVDPMTFSQMPQSLDHAALYALVGAEEEAP
jgi:hypothetical protein